nr:right-handed parallel beta-helix repeat-containing protein [Streptomyces boncukensis]
MPDYPVIVRVADTGQPVTALYEADGKTPIGELRSNPADSDTPGAIRAFKIRDILGIEYEYNGISGQPVRWFEEGREVGAGALAVAREALKGLDGKLDATGGTIDGDLTVTGKLTVDGGLPGGGLDAARIFDVRQRGAAGDGESDDAPAIQTALNAARDTGGGVVLVPPGTYRLVTLPLRIYRNTHLRCLPGARMVRAAAVTVLLNGDAGQQHGGYSGHGDISVEGGVWDMHGTVVTPANVCISIGHAERVTVRDVTVLDVPGYHAIEFNSTKTGRVLNCNFLGYTDPGGRDFSEAVQLDLAKGPAYFGGFGPYDDTPCADILIDGCTFGPSGTRGTTSWPRGIGSHSASPDKQHRDVRVTNSRFEGCTQYAIVAYTWENVVIEGVQMRDCGGGILVHPLDSSKTAHRTPAGGSSPTISGSQPLAGFTISDVTMTGGGTYGDTVEITGEETGYLSLVSVDQISVTGVASNAVRLTHVEDYAVHKVLAAGTGGTAISSLGTRRGRIEACAVNGSGGAGITVDSRSTPAAPATHVTISGCQVTDTAVNGVHLWSGTDVTVTDCDLHDLTGYGIQISTSAARPRLIGNRVRGTTSNGINITSTVTGVQRWGNVANSINDASKSPNTSPSDVTTG